MELPERLQWQDLLLVAVAVKLVRVLQDQLLEELENFEVLSVVLLHLGDEGIQDLEELCDLLPQLFRDAGGKACLATEICNQKRERFVQQNDHAKPLYFLY